MPKRNFKTVIFIIGMAITSVLSYPNVTYSQTNWMKRGSDPDKYKMSIDSTIQHNGKNVMTIKSIDQEINGFG